MIKISKHLFATLAVGVYVTAGLLLWPDPVLSGTRSPFEYIAPRPGAQSVMPQTSIAVRPGPLLDAGSLNGRFFRVQGGLSGRHTGRVVLADDGKTVLFYPSKSFTAGETVSVSVQSGLRTRTGRSVGGAAWRFTISPQSLDRATYDRLTEPLFFGQEPAQQPAEASSGFPGYQTLPADFPGITVTVPASNTAAGLLFISAFSWPDTSLVAPYALIVDNAGEPVFYQRQAPGRQMMDFKKQPNGQITYFDRGDSVVYGLDESYAIVDIYQAGNGYRTNPHDFQILPDGSQLYLIYDLQRVDMSQIAPGGLVTATVVGLVVQEQDPSRNVVFEGRSWDHFAITDTVVSLTDPLIDLTRSP